MRNSSKSFEGGGREARRRSALNMISTLGIFRGSCGTNILGRPTEGR